MHFSGYWMGWRPLLRLVTALFMLTCAWQACAADGKRLALVIGNDAYRNVQKLEKAGNDASAMARELKAAGFEVTLARDLDYRAMLKKIDFFTTHLTGGDQVVVFFAGHGVQLRSGSYLLPTDIEANSESEVEKTAISLNDVMDKLSEAKAAFALVLVDACRDNPLKSNGRALGTSRGLLPPDPPKGQMVVYSASKGQQALDKMGKNDTNPNGVFTREFIARMRKPGVRIEDLVRQVQDAVEDLAKTVGHDQRPAMYNEARGNFYFFGPTTVQLLSPVDSGKAPATSLQPSIRQEQVELALWDAIKDSKDPADFDGYLAHFPAGAFSVVAQQKKKNLAASLRNDSAPTDRTAQNAAVADTFPHVILSGELSGTPHLTRWGADPDFVVKFNLREKVESDLLKIVHAHLPGAKITPPNNANSNGPVLEIGVQDVTYTGSVGSIDVSGKLVIVLKLPRAERIERVVNITGTGKYSGNFTPADNYRGISATVPEVIKKDLLETLSKLLQEGKFRQALDAWKQSSVGNSGEKGDATLLQDANKKPRTASIAIADVLDMQSFGVGRCQFIRKHSELIRSKLVQLLSNRFRDIKLLPEGPVDLEVNVTPMAISLGGGSAFSKEYEMGAATLVAVRWRGTPLFSKAFKGKSVHSYPRFSSCDDWNPDISQVLDSVQDQMAEALGSAIDTALAQ